jgi:hypothetical protein
MRRGNLYDSVLAALEGGQQLTAVEVAEAIGCHRNNADFNLMKAHDAKPKLVRIVGYQQSRQGPPAPVFALGSLRDAPKPKPMTEAERALRYIRRNPALVRARKAAAAGRLNPYAQLMQG